jgi:hypothetical protein
VKINVNQAVTQLGGEPLMTEERGIKNGKDTVVLRPVTIGMVFQNACMAHPTPGSSYPADENIMRYSVAIEIERALKDHKPGDDIVEIEFDAKTAALLQREIARSYPPLVAGQVIPLLDGK